MRWRALGVLGGVLLLARLVAAQPEILHPPGGAAPVEGLPILLEFGGTGSNDDAFTSGECVEVFTDPVCVGGTNAGGACVGASACPGGTCGLKKLRSAGDACGTGSGTPGPTVTPFACATGYAVQVVGATPGCVLLPTPDGAGAGAAATQTPWSCGAGNGARGMGGTPECFVVPTPDGSVATVTPGGGTPQPIATSTSAPGTAAGFARMDHAHVIADGAIGAAKLAFTVPTPDGNGPTVGSGTPQPIATSTSAPGTSANFARMDHAHAIADGAIGPAKLSAAVPTPQPTATSVAFTNQPNTFAAGAGQQFNGDVFIGASGTFTLDGSGRFTPNFFLQDDDGNNVITFDPTGAGILAASGTGINRANDVVCTGCIGFSDLGYATPTPWPTLTPFATVTPTPILCATANGPYGYFGGLFGAHPESCLSLVTPTPTATVTATPTATVTPLPTPTEPFIRYWFNPTTVPASTPPGLTLHRNDLPGPPVVGTPTSTATFTPGGGVATITPTPTPTFTTGGGAATPTGTLSATPTPTVTPTPIGRQVVYDTLGTRTLATLDDLVDLQIGGTDVANGINVRALNFDSADFANGLVCAGSPPICAISLGASIMRNTTALLTSQMPTIAKLDDQDLCWGDASDFCIRWVNASSKATLTGLPEFAGNLQFKKEVDHAFTVDATTSSNTSGGGFTLTAANAVGVANGGSITLTAGSGLGGGDITLSPSGFNDGDVILNTTGSGSVLFSATNAATVGGRRHTTSNTAGVGLTLYSGGATSGATDKAAGTLALGPGISTGTGNALVKLTGRAKAVATGTSDNGVADRLVITGSKAVTDGTLTGIVDINIAAAQMAGGTVLLTCEATNGTDHQATSTQVTFSGVNKAGTMTCVGTELGADVTAASTGTLTVAVDATTGTAKCTVRVNCDTSLTASTGYPRVTYQVILNSGFAVTVSPL